MRAVYHTNGNTATAFWIRGISQATFKTKFTDVIVGTALGSFG